LSEQKLLLIHCDWSTNQDFNPEKPELSIKKLNIKCIGRADLSFILDSFMDYDGVLLIGCPIGDCHFIEGNIQTELKVKMLHKLMEKIGIEPARLSIKWASPSDQGSALKALDEYLEEFVGFGELRLDNLEPLKAARYTMENYRMRAFAGKELMLTEKGNAYGEKLPKEDLDEMIGEALELEFYRNWIHMILKTEMLSVKQLAKRVGLSPSEVLKHVVVLNKRGLIQRERADGFTPLYVAMEGQ
jgi:coenzyme F420-reducing hydrogenase delta subunit/DNA-binding transcriptional ArsR family regulator